MKSKFTRHSMLAAIAASFMLAGGFALPAYAATQSITLAPGDWKIDTAKSHFGSERNTMIIERVGASQANAGNVSDTFVVVSNGKVYLATASDAFDKSAANGIKKVDYARWKDMRLLQIGENAHVSDYCGFRCQSGGPEDHLTLTFRSVNGGMPETGNIVVYNQR
jgi:hypothetical protein